MKQLIKNALTALIAAAVVFGAAFSAEPVFASEETSQWALEAGGELVLANDIILSSDIKIEKSINIDLNGHQIINIGKPVRKSEYNGGDQLTHSVFCIDIAHGASVSIKNGTLIDVPIYNRGSDLRLEHLSIRNPHCEGITNRGETYRIYRCDIYAQSKAINSSGKLWYLEDSRISADRYEAVQGNFERISRCYISCEDSARGVALSDGNAGNRIKLVENCLLVGGGRGGISSWGGVENIRSCTVIGLGKNGDSSRGCAAWMALDKERSKPYIADCTLIAEDPGCGYYQGASAQGAFIEFADYSADCSFIKLSEIENIDEFLKWQPAAGGDQLAGAPSPVKLKNSFLNYRSENDYGAAGFTDIAGVSWAHSNIKRAYETGLMLGTGEARFSPAGSLSYAESLALAARLHSIFSGDGENFEQTDIWFEPYLSYAKKNGIAPVGAGVSGPSCGGCEMTDKEYERCLRPVSRSDFAALLAAALPDYALKAVNSVADGSIPDINAGADIKLGAGDELGGGDYHKSAASIYKLYRAGVITGSGKDGRFEPELPISRAEAACIITRMADPSLRVRFTMMLR